MPITNTPNTIQFQLGPLKVSLSKSKCWDSSPGPYGFHTLLKQYGGISFWHKGVVVQHGWAPADHPDANDLINVRHLMLCMSKRDKDSFKRLSDVRCEVAGSPFVHYRKMRRIEQSPDASGTVAFPAHSVIGLYANFDISHYCDELRSLPQKFHPITICLHPADITLFNMDEVYRSHGFSVVSAGMDKSKPFYESFYNILSRHRYATSNEPGSYLFYAVEMGLPFFMLGEVASRDNTITKNIDSPDGVYKITDFHYGKIAYDLFVDSERDVITPEQRKFVVSELGTEDCLTPSQLRAAFLDVGAKLYPCNSVFSRLTTTAKHSIKFPPSTHLHFKYFGEIAAHMRENSSD